MRRWVSSRENVAYLQQHTEVVVRQLCHQHSCTAYQATFDASFHTQRAEVALDNITTNAQGQATLVGEQVGCTYL